MKFVWHSAKAEKNKSKHGISFEKAITVFDDPFALIAPDTKQSTVAEKREWIIGESDFGILVVVFTIRQPGNIYRIISARRAHRKERKIYERAKAFPF
jgi:uncharacterized DUF497 family protein